MNPTDIQGFIAYARTIAQEFDAKINRLRYFVPQHNLSSGTANEIILRDFLAEIAPKRMKVGEGFICDPTNKGRVSKQCDILVFDQADYPLVHSQGNIQVVWPDSARMVIEVKTKLGSKKVLLEAIENVVSAKQNRGIFALSGFIFAFNSMTVQACISLLEQYPRELDPYYAPDAIFLLNQKTVFILRNNCYQVWKTKDEGTVLLYLLLSFLERISYSGGIAIQAPLLNSFSYLFEHDEMTLFRDNIQIGSKYDLKST